MFRFSKPRAALTLLVALWLAVGLACNLVLQPADGAVSPPPTVVEEAVAMQPSPQLDPPQATPTLLAEAGAPDPVEVTPLGEAAVVLPTPDVEQLQALMLQLVNEARAAEGLTPLAWDETAAEVGRQHALDMVAANYFSHWNREGLGPDHRYALGGGTHYVAENLHALTYLYENGTPAPIQDWQQVIVDAHEGLLASPGHRANILDPAHTHVGIAMAYDPTTGQFRLAQEFTNQYAELRQPLPAEAGLGQRVTVAGVLNGENLSNPLLDLAYEPFPPALTVEELNRTDTYASPAASVETRRIGTSFAEELVLNYQRQPGFYHIRIFVNINGRQAPVVDRVIVVR